MEKFLFYGSIIGFALYALFWIGMFLAFPTTLGSLIILVFGCALFAILGYIGYSQLQQNRNEEKDYDNIKF